MTELSSRNILLDDETVARILRNICDHLALNALENIPEIKDLLKESETEAKPVLEVINEIIPIDESFSDIQTEIESISVDHRTNKLLKDSKIDSSEKQNTFYNENFKELERIGSGAFGVVYKVMHRIDNSFYAIKQIKKNEMDKKNFDYAIKETKFLAKINCEYVVNYKITWIENDRLFIQMELCSDNLDNILKDKAKSFERQVYQPMKAFEYFICTHLFRELLECVQYLHSMKTPLIHRDLKPANILISYNDENEKYSLKLGDFGIATYHDNEHILHTSRIGTPKYAAPEIAQGNDYTTNADIYSLGMIAQDIFGVDINDSDSTMKCSEFIENEFSKLLDWITLMRAILWKQRPTCADVLNKYNEWSINTFAVKKCENSNSVLEKLKENKNQFFYKYLTEKLKSINE